MTELEATRLKLKALEMVEGTECCWDGVIRKIGDGRSLYEIASACGLHSYEKLLRFSIKELELALKVVEDKPVWGDSVIYNKQTGIKLTAKGIYYNEYIDWNLYTWNPPKPKTVMVELLVEDAKAICDWGGNRWYANLAKACRKALEEAKCQTQDNS